MTATYAAVMTTSSDSWLLLIVSLPTASATARMRIWRAIKTLGCAALRDGAYLLPAHAELAAQLRMLADEAEQEDGQAWLLRVQADAAAETGAYRALFDRTPDYTDWLAELSEARKTLPELAAVRAPTKPFARSISSRMRRPYAPPRSGGILLPPSRPSSRPASRAQPTATSPGATPPSTRAACGQHAATCGWTASPVPG
jgi:hypothetical protein